MNSDKVMQRKRFLTIAVFMDNNIVLRPDFINVKEYAAWCNIELSSVPVKCTCYSKLLPFIERITTTLVDALIVFESCRHSHLRLLIEKNKTFNVPIFSYVDESLTRFFHFPKYCDVKRINFRLSDGLNFNYLADLLKPLLDQPMNPIISERFHIWIQTGHGCNNVIEWDEKAKYGLQNFSESSLFVSNSNSVNSIVTFDKCLERGMDRALMSNMLSCFMQQLSNEEKKDFLQQSFKDVMEEDNNEFNQIISSSSSNFHNEGAVSVKSEASVPIEFSTSSDSFTHRLNTNQTNNELSLTESQENDMMLNVVSLDDLHDLMLLDDDLFDFPDDVDLLKEDNEEA